MKMPRFGTENPLFGYFWAGNLKNYYYVWNQHPPICQIEKFREKTKMPKFGNKNIVYFGTRIWKRLMSYLISTPSNLSNFGISWKDKNA